MLLPIHGVKIVKMCKGTGKGHGPTVWKKQALIDIFCPFLFSLNANKFCKAWASSSAMDLTCMEN